MKKLLSIAVIASLGISANINLMPYANYLNYSGSTTKKDGGLAGIYGSYLKSPFKIEMDVEATKLKYNNNTPNYNQHDFTLVGSYFYKNNLTFRAGIHNIWVNQADNDASYQKVLFSGVDYYQYLKYNVGVNVYYSTYRHFNVSQITPKAGYNFGNYYSDAGSFYAEIKADYIHISEANYAPKQHYTDVDMKLQNFKGPWTTTLNFSGGKNAYKVANDGFVVYNLGDEYKYSGGLSVNYKFQKTNNIKVSFSRAKFAENNKDAYSSSYGLSYLKSF